MIFSWLSPREWRRREAARWFMRMRGPGAKELQPGFDKWRSKPANEAAYQRIEEAFDASALLRLSRPGNEGQLGATPVSAQRRPTDRRGRFALAAVLALALLAPAGWFAAIDLLSPARPMLLLSSVGEMKSVSLKDGSRIQLDTDSIVEVPGGGQGREAILKRGRARFQPAHSDRPFKVKALMVEAASKGGSFDVRIDDGAVIVTSFSGVVDVSGRAGSKVAPQSAVRAEGAVATPIHVEDPAWPSGMLAFDAEPLGTAVRRANRYSSSKIRLGDPELEILRVTGAFRAGDMAGLAESLAAAFGLDLHKLPGGDLELSRRK